MSKKILLLGATGQVGQAIVSQLPSDGRYRLLTPSHQTLDFLTGGALATYVNQSEPDLIVNCVAYNQVDSAETEKALANRINALAVMELADVCQSRHIPLMHFSTDYVFPGKSAHLSQALYRETDRPAPINYYGQTKYAGEQAVCKAPANIVLRVSWVFSEFARNMGQHIISQALAGKPLSVATDQFGSPTYAGHIAEIVWALAAELLAGAQGGLYHLSGTEAVSRFQLAQAIVDELVLQGRLDAEYALQPTTQAQWMQSVITPVAQRPAFSALGCQHLAERLGRPITSWRAGLAGLVAGL